MPRDPPVTRARRPSSVTRRRRAPASPSASRTASDRIANASSVSAGIRSTVARLRGQLDPRPAAAVVGPGRAERLDQRRRAQQQHRQRLGRAPAEARLGVRAASTGAGRRAPPAGRASSSSQAATTVQRQRSGIVPSARARGSSAPARRARRASVVRGCWCSQVGNSQNACRRPRTASRRSALAERHAPGRRGRWPRPRRATLRARASPRARWVAPLALRRRPAQPVEQCQPLARRGGGPGATRPGRRRGSRPVGGSDRRSAASRGRSGHRRRGSSARSSPTILAYDALRDRIGSDHNAPGDRARVADAARHAPAALRPPDDAGAPRAGVRSRRSWRRSARRRSTTRSSPAR